MEDAKGDWPPQLTDNSVQVAAAQAAPERSSPHTHLLDLIFKVFSNLNDSKQPFSSGYSILISKLVQKEVHTLV